MKEISITLEGEEAVFFWKEGQAYTEGYDLASEKTLLALTRYGSGVGVLLVAINNICKTEEEFNQELNSFMKLYAPFVALPMARWAGNQLLFEYFSYSPEVPLRWQGLERTELTKSHFARIWADRGEEIKLGYYQTELLEVLAKLETLPEEYFPKLLELQDPGANWGLVENKNTPGDILEFLARDKDIEIRWSVAGNPKCTSRP